MDDFMSRLRKEKEVKNNVCFLAASTIIDSVVNTHQGSIKEKVIGACNELYDKGYLCDPKQKIGG